LNKKDFNEFYKLGPQVGSGAYSVVYSGKRIADGNACAIKVIDKEGTNNEQMQAELEVMSRLSHPNIVNYIEIFDLPTDYYVVLEFVNGGELFDRIIELQRYSEKDAIHVMRQALEALDHLHSRNIAHRDLKPENLLLSSKEPSASIKLADFGFALECVESNLFELIGTPPYMAPEIVRLRSPVRGMPGYGKAVDIWAMGLILYILLSGYHPFQLEDEDEMLDNIETGNLEWKGGNWALVSDDAKDLIRNMIQGDPKHRFTAKQCLQHKWMVDEKNAPDEDLGKVAEEIKKFQAKKKFKGAIFGVMATNKFKNLIANLNKN
jgi:serine/threonine protein kinase